ncbi:MAG: hypothetical protein ACU0BF_09830 [Paracoccaceae bacterium]
MGAKIATCCYCGTRAALVLDRERHELTCAACGAPLHEMKRMPEAESARPRKPKKTAPRHGAHDGVERPVAALTLAALTAAARGGKRGKKRKKRTAKKIWDTIEDAFDDIFD